MRSTPYVIDWPVAGRLAIMPRPNGGESLDDEMLGLRAQSVDTLVCALTYADRVHLDLIREPEAAVAAGLAYREFPIGDFGIPDRDALVDLSHELAHEVRDGRFVVAHCAGGIGRSGLIAGATLIALGAAPDPAMHAISAARGHDAPETFEQKALLRQLVSE